MELRNDKNGQWMDWSIDRLRSMIGGREIRGLRKYWKHYLSLFIYFLFFQFSNGLSLTMLTRVLYVKRLFGLLSLILWNSVYPYIPLQCMNARVFGKVASSHHLDCILALKVWCTLGIGHVGSPSFLCVNEVFFCLRNLTGFGILANVIMSPFFGIK